MNDALFNAVFPHEPEITEKDLLTDTIDDMLQEERLKGMMNDRGLEFIDLTDRRNEKEDI